MTNLSKLQYISSGNSLDEHYRHICEALNVGIDWIQLRVKNCAFADYVQLAQQIRNLQDNCPFTFIVNDNPYVAKESDADGLHLGLADTRVADARLILGTHKIIGGTANTLDDIIQRREEQCDYIGLGPLRYTKTKKNLSPILGLSGYQKIMEAISIDFYCPIFAIGGIQKTDIIRLRNIGIYGIALSTHLQQNFNSPPYIKQIKDLLYGQ
ncbi:thiamine phosphate synthase [Sphingobacterium sp. LRF_L2]|uniref:thiamine phosphate synthase n=1 Tax=Sphingobacterium sp. LRF_L2 TaxID=3369421 RepID=UPI003F601A31